MKIKMLLPICLLAAVMVSTSCKKKKVDDKLPDAVVSVDVTIGGVVVHDIDFTLPEQVSGTSAANGSYNAIIDIFQILMLEGATWNMGILENTGGVKTGSWQLNDGATDMGSYFHTTVMPGGMSSTSGTFNITKTVLRSDVLGVKDWYVDGNFNMEMSDGNTPAVTGNIKGTFTGINIKE